MSKPTEAAVSAVPSSTTSTNSSNSLQTEINQFTNRVLDFIAEIKPLKTSLGLGVDGLNNGPEVVPSSNNLSSTTSTPQKQHNNNNNRRQLCEQLTRVNLNENHDPVDLTLPLDKHGLQLNTKPLWDSLR